jgi:hypothetical protein
LALLGFNCQAANRPLLPHDGVVKQHRDQEILVRGVTSPCWPSP